MNANRTAAIARWTTAEIAFRLASDEMFGVNDVELNRALQIELVSRVGLSIAAELIEQESEALDAERQDWGLEQLAIHWALERGETAEQGREMHRRLVAKEYVAV